MRKLTLIVLSLLLTSIFSTAQSTKDINSTSLAYPNKLVRDIDFSPNNKLLSSIAANNAIVIWDSKTWKILKELEPLEGEIQKLKFSDDGKYLACKTEKEVQIWKTKSWKKIATYSDFTKDSPIAFHPTKPQIIGVSKKKIILHNFLIKNSSKIDISGGVKKSEKTISDLHISPDGKNIYTLNLGNKRPLKLYDVSTLRIKRTFEIPETYGANMESGSIDLSPDGKLLVYRSDKNADFLIFDTNRFDPVFSLPNNQENGNAYFTSTSRHLVLASKSNIQLYDLFNKKNLLELDSFNLQVMGNGAKAITSPDGKTIAGISEEGKILIWDLSRFEKTVAEQKETTQLSAAKRSYLDKFESDLKQIKIPQNMIPTQWKNAGYFIKEKNNNEEDFANDAATFFKKISAINDGTEMKDSTVAVLAGKGESEMNFQKEMETKWEKYSIKNNYSVLVNKMITQEVPEFAKKEQPYFYFFIVENGNSSLAYTDIFELKRNEKNQFLATTESLTRQLKLKGYKRMWLQGAYADQVSAQEYQSLLDDVFYTNGVKIDQPISFAPKGAKRPIQMEPLARVEQKPKAQTTTEAPIIKPQTQKKEIAISKAKPKEALAKNVETNQPTIKEENIINAPKKETAVAVKPVEKKKPTTTSPIKKEEIAAAPTKPKTKEIEKVQTPQPAKQAEKTMAQTPTVQPEAKKKSPKKTTRKTPRKKSAPSIAGFLVSSGYSQYSEGADENDIIKKFMAKNGNSLLLFLLEKEKFDLARKVISNSSAKDIINDKNEDGLTALHIACQKNDPKMLDYILYRNPEINAQDANGWTPMHYAINAQNLKMVKLLKRYRANLSIKNKDGMSAVKFARKYGTKQIVSLLKK